ncbi:MAG: methyltransferase domain-containing protein [Bacteroidota bacterium]|jgi:SAM-dependent methyltransferase
MQQNWFKIWFDSKYYHFLYKHRDHSEAVFFIDQITTFLKLKSESICWDLCCGKGRHSIYLNEKGYRVIGTDLSEKSIQEASRHTNDTLEFYTHDMRKLFRANYFDVVFNLFTSFGYFEKKEDDVNVFKSIEKALKSNGLFVFDFLNENFIKNNLNQSDTIISEGIIFQISKRIENNTVIKSIDFKDDDKDYHFEERVKLFDRKYFEELANASNLKIINSFGNYQLDEFNLSTSPRLILLLQKK